MSTLDLQTGDFVRVRKDHPEVFENRAGKDGMVVSPVDDGKVGLTFGYDRYNTAQGCICVGVEEWDLTELDLTTICR